MLRPSYAELMSILNKESEDKDVITSRYTIVIAAAKRARQLIDGDLAMVNEKRGKPVSTAVEELRFNKIKVVPEGEGTVLKLEKKFDSLNGSNDMNRDDDEPLFDYTTVETISSSSDNDDIMEDEDDELEFEEEDEI